MSNVRVRLFRFTAPGILAALAACSSATMASSPAPMAAPLDNEPDVTPVMRQAPDSRPGVAVFPFTNGGSYGASREDLDALEVGVQELLLGELSANTNLRVVERSRLREILDEQNLARVGRIDVETAARIGKVIGARYVITGVFVDLDGVFRMDGRIVDVETSEILRTQQVQGRRDDLYALLVELSTKITQGVNLPPLSSDMRQQRMNREIPTEAITLFSRAQVYRDGGYTDWAIQLYERIAQQFPQMTEAEEALREIRGG